MFAVDPDIFASVLMLEISAPLRLLGFEYAPFVLYTTFLGPKRSNPLNLQALYPIENLSFFKRAIL